MSLRRRTRIFALLTLGLVAAALAWGAWRHRTHAPERAAYGELTRRIGVHRGRIDSLEAWLGKQEARLDREKANLASANRRIGHYESRAEGGRLPTPDYRRYRTAIERQNEVVARHNEVVGSLQETYAEYSAAVDTYNALVDSANTLQRRAVEEGFDLPQPEGL